MNTFQCYRIFGDRTDRTSVCNFLDGKRNTLVFDLDKYLPPCCTGEKPFHKLWLIAEARDIAIMPPACVLTVFCCQVYSLYAHSYLGAFSADYHVESLVGRLWRLGMMCFFPVVTGKPLNQAPPPLWWNPMAEVLARTMRKTRWRISVTGQTLAFAIWISNSVAVEM